MDIGKKLKELRLQNDLTLGDLASRSELTKGFLSQVERNLTTPSIATLEDILEALGTNLSEFFHEEEEQQIVFSTQDFFVDEQEDYQIEWVIPNAQKNRMEPILLTLKPHKKKPDSVCTPGRRIRLHIKRKCHFDSREQKISTEIKRDLLPGRLKKPLFIQSHEHRSKNTMDHNTTDVLRKEK